MNAQDQPFRTERPERPTRPPNIPWAGPETGSFTPPRYEQDPESPQLDEPAVRVVASYGGGDSSQPFEVALSWRFVPTADELSRALRALFG